MTNLKQVKLEVNSLDVFHWRHETNGLSEGLGIRQNAVYNTMDYETIDGTYTVSFVRHKRVQLQIKFNLICGKILIQFKDVREKAF